jgi:hypothetical protein
MRTTEPLEIQFEGVHCKITLRRFSPTLVLVTISGTDIGEFGQAPMLKIQELMGDADPIQLFIDARKVRGASIEVSGDWAKWLGAHKTNLRRVSMLPGSRFIELTAEFVRRFAELRGIMRIYTDAAAFDADLSESVRGN